MNWKDKAFSWITRLCNQLLIFIFLVKKPNKNPPTCHGLLEIVTYFSFDHLFLLENTIWQMSDVSSWLAGFCPPVLMSKVRLGLK